MDNFFSRMLDSDKYHVATIHEGEKSKGYPVAHLYF